jgi:hypothetical protein
MHLLVPLLLLAGIFACVGVMVRDAQRQHRKAERSQEELIAKPPQLPRNGELVFRKPKLFGYALIFLFVSFCAMAVYSVIHNGRVLNIAGLRAGTVVLIGLYPLAIGMRSLRYAVRVSTDELLISDFTTKVVPLRNISAVKIIPPSGFCQIRLTTGEEDLKVTSDLENFPEFVSLLCNSVDASKTGKNTNTGPTTSLR